ncbi:hypothetical protein KZO01_24730 [Kurthia zopfii]|uniref:histidine kinase n=1 Tax=Kurthia zopfii TaxID=1650 RepID=A0A8B4Q8T4_9BACL|nr:ATP-binding protein [Kurthia zopfii]TDR33831.1 PAS domain S-box-containing protein [Kurthia zopfii]GEK32164.1 hypothetical protein KZO01_24730 [Kurthia zopfii]STX08890.1 Sporulation kinase A [Kurthia zopfii]VEI04903.1 Sporulation kinase A [Kurthia zopfii]
MGHSSRLRSRNKVVLSIITASIVLYGFVSLIQFFTEINHFPLYPFILCFITIALFLLKTNELIICTLNIITLNIFLIHMIVASVNLYFTIFLILALFIISIYQSAYLNAISIFLFGSEIAWFFYVWYPEIIESIGRTNLTVLIIILSFLSAISLIQGFYFSMSYKNIETKSNEVEKDFLSKEGYLKLFFENAKDSIAVFDLNNRVIAVNPAFENLYGWKVDECIGKHLPMVPPEHFEDSCDRINRMKTGENFHLLETVDMKKDGTTFEAEVTLSPIFSDQGEIIATSVITRDISYRKETEQLRIQSEKLNLAGEIAAGVAHEIRNPLTVIVGFIQMMQVDESSPYAYYYKLINEEIERINLIINEFLILSKPHARETKQFEINELLHKTALLYEPNMKTSQIQFDVDLEQKDLIVNGDANQLKQVFINILKNALEASHSNDSISMKTSMENDEVVISIQDTGAGMSKEVVNQIFQPFYTTKEHGTGLGMMITQKIVQEHEGTINIESDLGYGTKISIKLPILHSAYAGVKS